MDSFLPQFANLPLTVIGFLLAMTIIVGVHEFGHYIVGRWTGIKAEVFSIGMGPVLWARQDRHGTVWQIAALPLGGFVRFKGDANAASMGSDGQVYAETRSTMNGAPLWARTLTVLAGPVFNFILTLALYTGLMMMMGRIAEPYVVAEVAPMPPEYGIELQEGDEILSINGLSYDDPALADLPLAQSLPYEVRRDGARQTVQGPYPYAPIVASLVPNFPAHQAGLALGDVITHVDGVPVYSIGEMIDHVTASEGATLALTVWRAGQGAFEAQMAPRMMDLPHPEGGYSRDWKVGLSSAPSLSFEAHMIGPFEALGRAWGALQNLISMTFSTMGSLLTGEIKASENLQGMVGMAQSTGMVVEQGWVDYIAWIAVLSASIGLLNLFPIPMLDGGHLVFYLYEALTGRRVPDKLAYVLMTIGLALVVSLMLYALSLDLSRLFAWGK